MKGTTVITNMKHPVNVMVEVARENKVDVLRLGIPVQTFIDIFENNNGTMYESFYEDLLASSNKGYIPVIKAVSLYNQMEDLLLAAEDEDL